MPNLEFYQIVIALDPAGKKVSATLPKAIALDWSVPDPSAVQGPPEKVHAAHEETFQHIQKHIQDLCTAILEPPTPKNP